MTDSVTSEDAQSSESTKITPISTDADLPTQVSEIIDRVEKQQGSINHIRKTVRMLRDRVTMPDGLPQGSANPLSAKEQNEALSRYVDRTTFKNQMKQIAIKIDEIMKSQKGHSQKELEDKIDEAFKQISQEKEKIDHVMTTDNQRIDIITEKMETNVSDTAKAITQLKNGIEDVKLKLKNAIKQTVTLTRADTSKVQNSLEEFQKTELENFKKVNTTILQLSEEITKLKNGNTTATEPSNQAGAPAPTSNADLTNLISRIDQLELIINSKTEELSLKIEEIAQNVKNNEKITEDLSSKMSDFDNQYSLDCEQRREHDTEIDTELSKVKLSIEAAETEVKNQTEKLTSDFDDKLSKLKLEMIDNNKSEINSATSDYDQKINDQKKQLEDMIKDPSTFDSIKNDLSQQLEEMKKQMESTNIDQLKTELEEQKKQIESLSNNTANIDQLKSEITSQLEEQKKQIDSLSNDTSKVDSLKTEINQQLDELKARIQSTNSDTSNIDSLRSQINEEIEQLKKGFEKMIDEKISSNSDQQMSQITSIINNSTTINDIKTEINQRFEEQKTQINTLITNISNIESAKSELEEKLNTQQKQIESSSNDNEQFDKKLNDLKSELTSLIDQQVTNIDTSVQSATKEHKTLIDGLTQDKTKLEMLNKIITGQINDIKNEIKTKEAETNKKIELISTQLSKGEAKGNDITSDAVMMLQDQISALRRDQEKHAKQSDETINNLKTTLTQKVDLNQSEQIHGLIESQIHEIKEGFNKQFEELKSTTNSSPEKKVDPNEFEKLKEVVEGLKQYEQKHNEFESKIKNTKDDCERQISQLKTIYESSVTEIKTIYQQSITELKSKTVKTLEEKMDHMTEEFQKIKELQAQPQVVERSIDLPNQDIQDIQKQLDELKNDQKQNSQKNESSINDLAGKLDNLRNDVASVQSLKETITTIESRVEQINQLNEKVIQIEKETNTIQSLTETINTINSKVEQVNQLNEKVLQIEKETNTIQSLTETINTINSKVEQVNQLNEKVLQIEKETNTLQSLTETINTINSKVEQVNQLSEKVSQIEKETNTLQSLTETINTINSKVEQVNQLSEKVSQIEKETNTLQSLTETINTINSKVEQVNQLSEKVSQIEKETNTLQSLTETINTINSKVEQVNQLSEKVSQIEKETNTIQSLTEKVNTMNEQIEHATQLEEKLSTIENSVKDVQTREIKLETSPDTSKLDDLEKNLQVLKEKVDMMSQQNEQLTTQLSEFKDEYNKNVNSTAEIISETVSSFKTAHDDTATEIQEIKDKVGEVVNKMSEETLHRLQALEDSFSSVSEKSNKCSSDLDELKGKMYTTFVTADALDTIKQKRKNLKENVKTMVTELNSYIETERNERTKSIEDINSQIEVINQALKDSSEKQDLESKYNKEQIRKMLKQINRISKSKDSGDGENQTQSASPELIMDVDELKFKLKQMEEINTKYKDDISEINKSLQDFTTKINEQKDDYSNRISNLEFVSNSEQKDMMEKISKLEEQIDAAKKSVDNLPGMVMEANQMNQASINEFSQHVEDTLTDMKSQLKQATFADDDITELTKKFSTFEENFNKSNLQYNNKFDKMDAEMKQRREAENEHSKMWAAINDVKVKIDVQIEKTNPQFSNLISKLSKSHKEIKEIVTKQNDTDEAEPESEENAAPPPEYAAQIEMLKAKVQMLEDEGRKSSDQITHLKEIILLNKDSIDRSANQIREEMTEMRNKLPESFIEIDSFNGLKEEVNVIHGALNTTIETTVSEREKIEEQLNSFNETMASMQSNVKNEVQSLLQHALKNSNISTKDLKITDEDDDEDDDKPKMPTAVIGAEDSSTNNLNNNEVSDLKLMINGIDIALQRQIRKLKISVRNIERMLEDAAEEEKRQQEIEKQKKEKEELEREIIQEENEKKKLERENNKVEEEEEDVDNEVIQLNNDSQKVVQVVQQAPGAVIVVDPDHNNTSAASQSAVITTVRLPTAIELIQDDFNIFFVLMFSVLLYFLVSDLFLS